jgi:hypothetical protein
VSDLTGTFTASLTNCNIVATNTFAIFGAHGVLNITGGSAISNNVTVSVGTEGASSIVTTGTLSGMTITSTASYALLIGYGSGGMIVDGVIINGGNYGVVIKQNTGATLRNSTLRGGTVATVYCKGAINPVITNNTISTAVVGLLVGIGDSGQKSSGVALNNNRFIVYDAGSIFSWSDSSGDGGGSVSDYNRYHAGGSGKFGSVYGTANIKTLAGVKAAWSTYGDGSNDRHSRVDVDELVQSEPAQRQNV